MTTHRLLLGIALALLASPIACSHVDEPETTMPVQVRSDYAVFALRCSKCHSLARPLNSGIDNDEYWKRYVERMRRQPGSGISVADTVPILRYLHVYSIALRKRKQEQRHQDGAALDAPVEDGGLAPTGAR
ncbi:MAG TPA: hypothetical protein VFK05_33570 [Polyangiaceae bacterium]|nr:hypothetical protein [Polyangiaceae bacterium]